MRLMRSFEEWLRRTRATDEGGRYVQTVPYAGQVVPVEIVSDARPLTTPYQRKIYWDRIIRTAVVGEFAYVGVFPTRLPVRIHYWEIESITAGNSFLCAFNMGLIGLISGFVAPLEPIEGPRALSTQIPFSMTSLNSAGSDGQVVGARVCPWIEATKPVVMPGQAWGSQCITDGEGITVIMAFEELPTFDPVSQPVIP